MNARALDYQTLCWRWFTVTSFSQKERLTLEDQKHHEEICITKYDIYASQAKDPKLKQLFSQYKSIEQQHYDTVNQLLQGQSLQNYAGAQGKPGQSSQGYGNQSYGNQNYGNQSYGNQGYGTSSGASKDWGQTSHWSHGGGYTGQNYKSSSGQASGQQKDSSSNSGASSYQGLSGTANTQGGPGQWNYEQAADWAFGKTQSWGSQPNAFSQGWEQGSQPAVSDSIDYFLCSDMTLTENFISSSYNNAVFAMSDSQVIKTLQHIQKEEQEHGEGIKKYMEQHGWTQKS